MFSSGLDNIENNSDSFSSEKNEKQEQSVAEKERLLEDICQKKGNPIKIEVSGRDFDELPNLKESLVVKEEFKELVKDYLVEMFKIVHGPIFTDTFGVDHSKRREWEDKNIYPSLKVTEGVGLGIAKDLRDYYDLNNLRTTNLAQVINFARLLEMDDEMIGGEDKELIKEELNRALQIIPDDFQEYKFSDDEFKIAKAEEIREVMKNVLKVMSNDLVEVVSE